MGASFEFSIHHGWLATALRNPAAQFRGGQQDDQAQQQVAYGIFMSLGFHEQRRRGD